MYFKLISHLQHANHLKIMQDLLILRDLQSGHTSLPLLYEVRANPYDYEPTSTVNELACNYLSNLQYEKHQPSTSSPPGIEKTSGMDEDFFTSSPQYVSASACRTSGSPANVSTK